MSIYKYRIVPLLFIIGLLTFSSCKKSGKELLEKVSKESVEKSSEKLAKETSERTIKSISKKELKSLDWSDIIKLIRKENINLADALQRLDGSFQKKVGRAINTDYEFYSALVSSSSFVDEFSVLVKNAPNAANDINVFKYFVKCRDLERRFGVPNSISNIALHEEMGVIKLVDKGSNKILGELKDGIYIIKQPFIAGTNLLNNSSVLKKTLIPNSVYRIKGANGLSYLYHVDDLGRFSKIESKNVNANELVSNVIFAKENINLGSEWTGMIKKVRQTSKGGDINATIVFKYADDGTTPLAVKADVKVNNKKIIAQSFENLDNVSKRIFTTAENSAILDKVASKTGLTSRKKADLLGEMGADEELAKLIHSNPDVNVKRWLNTRNHVDKNLVAKTANGRMVPNGQVYAGNVYYFNPHLNSGLKARLKNSGTVNLKKFGSFSYEDLIKLDKLYPDGVPFTKEGFPDFTKVAFKDNSGNTLKINIGQLSGDSKKDIQAAETLFQKMGYKWESGYTWHHIENSTELIRVPSAIHQLIDHAGGMSTHAAKQVVRQAA